MENIYKFSNLSEPTSEELRKKVKYLKKDFNHIARRQVLHASKEVYNNIEFIHQAFDVDKNFIKYIPDSKKQTSRNDLFATWIEIKNNDNHIEEQKKHIYRKNGEIVIGNSYTNYTHVNKVILKHLYPDCFKRNVHTSYGFSGKEFVRNFKIITDCTYGGYLKENSDIFVIDIDNHNNTDKTSMLQLYYRVKKRFGNENILLTEKSYQYGFHIYVKLNRVIDKDKKAILIDQVIKRCLSNKTYIQSPCKIRFPLSCQYQPVEPEWGMDVLSKEEAGEIALKKYNNSEGFNCDYLFESENEPVVNKEIVVNTDNIITNETIKESIIDKNNNEIDVIKTSPGRDGRGKAYFTVLEKSNYSNYKSVKLPESINAGERNDNFLLIARVLKAQGKTIDEAWDYIISHIGSSKDLNNSKKIPRLRKDFEQIYSKADVSKMKGAKKSKYMEEGLTEFIDNTHLIPKVILKGLRTEQFKKDLQEKLNNNNMEITYSKDKILNGCTELIIQLIGKMYYQALNPRIANKKFNPDGTDSIVGVQFSEIECKLLSKQYPELFENIDVYNNILNTVYYFSDLFFLYKKHFFNPNQLHLSRCRQFIFGDITNQVTDITTLTLHIIRYLNNTYESFKRYYVMFKSYACNIIFKDINIINNNYKTNNYLLNLNLIHSIKPIKELEYKHLTYSLS